MNVSKDVYTIMKAMIEKELSNCQYKIRDNKYKINQLSKEQRLLKSQIGELYKMAKQFK